MTKLLRSRDILFLILAGIGDVAQELKDPMQIMGKSYEAMYGFIPARYKRSNFFQTVERNLKTGDIEKIVKDGKVYLRLTSVGRSKAYRDFPILSLTRKWNEHWVIVIFDIEEKSKAVRDKLRNKLKGLGFGMLQKSIWLSPLPIGQDMKEIIEFIGLSKDAYVMEVSGFIFGDPKELVRKIWNLERLEEVYIGLKSRIDTVNRLLKKVSDRENKREAKLPKSTKSGYKYNLAKKKREEMRAYLEFLVNFPPLPRELLSENLKNVYIIPD